MYKINIPQKADIVLVSAGGFPKDINMYQAQKALDNAQHAVKDGGIIIWIASCKSGLGEKTFQKWMLEHENSNDMIEHIKRDFQLGGHKAAAIAMVLEKAKIFLVSDLNPDLIRKFHFTPYKNASEALKYAVEVMGREASIIAMPYGGSTLPVLD
jgi:nickel-dependent lactate racemase